LDKVKNVEFWDKAARESKLENKSLAGMLAEGREFDAIYRSKAERERFSSFYSPPPNASVLEVGSGGGRWALYLADKVKAYVGIDISQNMVSLAEEICSASELENVQFECTDLENHDANVKYDLIYFSGVLQYMDDETVSSCLNMAISLLTEEGVIISRDSIQLKFRVERQGDYPVIYRTEREYADIFQQEGLERTYLHLSYDAKRFTRLASRIYQIPGISYQVAYFLREIFCSVNSLLGEPKFLMPTGYSSIDNAENAQQHVFSKYVQVNKK
jgi:SAM-dependent methyltransferase